MPETLTTLRPRRWRSRPNRLWKRGAKPQIATGPVHISMNDYWVYRWRDVPKIARIGMRFRRHWPETQGAVGLWFAAFSRGRRQVSVSVWRSPEDLQHFVHSPVHRQVMRDYRDAGLLYTTTWTAPAPDRRAIWAQADDRLKGRIDGVPHHR